MLFTEEKLKVYVVIYRLSSYQLNRACSSSPLAELEHKRWASITGREKGFLFINKSRLGISSLYIPLPKDTFNILKGSSVVAFFMKKVVSWIAVCVAAIHLKIQHNIFFQKTSQLPFRWLDTSYGAHRARQSCKNTFTR